MKGKYTYDYWRPAVTVDNVVFRFDGTRLNVLLIRRGRDPFQCCWAFPGGFLDEKETLKEAAERELMEETGLKSQFMTEIGSFSALDRDPRGRTITIAFASVVRPSQTSTLAGDDASECRWFPIAQLPTLAFDHDQIIKKAITMLRVGFISDPVPFVLLNDTFTLPEMQRLYTEVFCREFDRRNFQKKFLSSGILSPVDSDKGGKKSAHAPIIYRFNETGYRQLKEKFLKG